MDATVADREFRRLDITGEGRLTYLNLKTALQLRGVEGADDGTVKRWVRENDRGAKGYVDFNDYQAIFADAAGGAAESREPGEVGGAGGGGGRGLSGRTARDTTRAHDAGVNLPGSRRYGTLQAPAPAPAADSRSPSPSPARPPVDRARLQLLKRAFDRYDVDGDGRISVDDLQLAFAAQGRPAAELNELVTWVRRRDRSGVGLYVNFNDFVDSYR